jgi:type IV pilus assembly protein PilX
MTRIKNEDGSILVVALIILVLLTILGVTISSTSEVELQIAGNEEQYKMNLYQAAAGAMECARFMGEEDELDPDDDANDYLHPKKDPDLTYDPPHIIDTIRTDDPWGDTTKSAAATVDPANTWYLAVYAGVPPGTQLDDDGNPRVHEYTIFARSTGVRGSKSIVKMGYRRAQ